MTELGFPTIPGAARSYPLGPWFKRVGDPVTVQEPLVEIETDNVTDNIRMPVRWITFALLGAAAIWGGQPSVCAQPLRGDAVSGRQIAVTQCSSCHRVQPMQSPNVSGDLRVGNDGPPSFQSVADMTSTTALSLNVFLRSNHQNMPNIMLNEAEADDIIAYLLGLKKQ